MRREGEGPEVGAMVFDLPNSLSFGGRAWRIDADYRQVLRVLAAGEDPVLSDAEKATLCLYNLYVNFGEIPPTLWQAAYDAAVAFIDHGSAPSGGARTMDWTQDADLIFPAVNRVAGFEVRSVAFMHWWTFLGYFMELRDSVYATVLALRQKRAAGKKLEKWEQDYWRQNRALCELRPRYDRAERAERERLERMLGGQ